MTKHKYSKPELKRVKIDNHISMVMMSEVPPTGPGESLGVKHSTVANPYNIAKS